MMKRNRKAVSLFVLLLASTTTTTMWAQLRPATLRVTTDLDCNWKLDGMPQGLLKSNDAKVIPSIRLGDYVIAATTTDGQLKRQMVVYVSQAGQKLVSIQLKGAYRRHLADDPTWTDPATGLMWTRKDDPTGHNLDWHEATDYCRNLHLAGYSDWRLPKVDELAGIDETQRDRPERHVLIRETLVKGEILLTTFWYWSSTVAGVPNYQPGLTPRSGPSIYDFQSGWGHFAAEGGKLGALCVRRSGK